MEHTSSRKNSSSEILILAFLVAAIILFFGQPKTVKSAPVCDCDVTADCPGYCPTPATPSGLWWITVSNDETQLEPTWGVGTMPDYFHLTGSVDANTSNVYYLHSGLNPGTNYSYQVQGCNTNCQFCGPGYCMVDGYTGLCTADPDVCGSYSSSWNKTTQFHAPTGFSVGTCVTSGTSANASMSWTDNSSAESGYKIEYKYSTDASYSECATKAANSTSHTQTGLLQGRSVSFRTRAYHNSGTYSSYSGTDSCTTPISNPSGLSCSTASATQINISWSDNSNGEQNYILQRKTWSGGSWSDLVTLAANTTSYSNTGLSNGTSYYYRVRAETTWYTSGYSNEDNCTTTLPAPSGLACSVASNTQINLSWNDNSNSELGFKIERVEGSGCSGFSQIDTVGSGVESYSNTGLSQGTTYCYRVGAYTSATTSYSGNSTCTTTLAAPSSLTATGVSSSQINLSWTDNSTGESGFKIERGDSNCNGFSQIDTAAANATTYSNTGLTEGTQYCYRVRAYTSYTDSSYSNQATAATIIAAPSSLSASVDGTDPYTKINLSWVDNSGGETGFKIERATGSCSSFSQITTVAANSTSYQDSGLSEGTTYCYRIRAYTTYTNSDYSNNASTTTSLHSPSSLTATTASATQINLSWTDNSTGESGFKIERATGSCSSFSQITTVAANTVSYYDTGLANGTTYCYQVRAYTSYINSSYSNTASATTTLPAPSNLNCTVQGATEIDISWTDNSTGESGFRVERASPTCSSFSEITTTNPNITSYQNTGLSAGTAYCYQVRAYTSYTNSSYSNTSSCTTQNPPPAPSNLSANAVSSTQINLSWTDNSSNETGFRLRRAEGASCSISSSLIDTLAANTTSYNNTGLSQGTQYCYVVCSYNADGEACSSSATATTSLPAPTSLAFGSIGVSSINLSWTDNSTGETGFKIERATNGCSGFSQIATTGSSISTYTDSSLSCSGASYNTYCYRVRAYTSYLDSDYATTTGTKATLPCPASGLSASVASSSQINLLWTDNSGNESGFKIERKTGSGGTYSEIYTASANATSYNNTELGDGTVYYYRLRPYNSDGNSNYSNESFATTTLPVPSNLVATAISSSQINLSWTDNSTNESGFKIERGETSPPTTEIATVAKGVVSYSNINLPEDVTYYYRVRAYNSNIYSDYSNESSTTTPVYVPHGYLESPIFDTGVATGVAFNSIMWKGTLPSTSHVRFQFASSNSTSTWTFIGPDGTETSYYEASGPDIAIPIETIYHNNHRYFRYRIYLNPTSDSTETPTVTDVIIGYSP